MNKHKEKYPTDLETTQKWFANIITNKLDDDYINTVTPHGMLVAEESARYIVPSKTLQPHQRMQIYNQQYWWRLLKALHENFPLVTRLFGYYAFNEEIAIPYLLKYPPKHWSLNVLGDLLPKWVQEDYKGEDRSLIYQATALDWACNASFVAPKKSHLTSDILGGESQEKLMTYKFYLQPHIHLFNLEFDLFTFRDAFLLKDVDYWTENDFPPLAKGRPFYFVIFRSHKNLILWKEISVAEYTVLQELKAGATIQELCDHLETQPTDIFEEVSQNLQQWLQRYTIHHWLTLDNTV